MFKQFDFADISKRKMSLNLFTLLVVVCFAGLVVSAQGDGPCVQAAEKEIECMESGYYKLIQCHPGTGECWCVDALTGNKIKGTDMDPSKGTTPECSACHHWLAETAADIVPGTFVPSCTAEGKYNKEQCHGSIGFCWCVDETTGAEIEGTRQRGDPAC